MSKRYSALREASARSLARFSNHDELGGGV
jgi:hypothetical protein